MDRVTVAIATLTLVILCFGFVDLVYATYENLTSPTFVLRKDRWECTSHDRVFVGKTMMTRCTTWERLY